MNAGRWLGVYLGLEVDDSEIGSSTSRTPGRRLGVYSGLHVNDWECILDLRWIVGRRLFNQHFFKLVFFQINYNINKHCFYSRVKCSTRLLVVCGDNVKLHSGK